VSRHHIIIVYAATIIIITVVKQRSHDRSASFAAKLWLTSLLALV
jgi:hypothetical protein